jgi:hypothetical protein
LLPKQLDNLTEQRLFITGNMFFPGFRVVEELVTVGLYTMMRVCIGVSLEHGGLVETWAPGRRTLAYPTYHCPCLIWFCCARVVGCGLRPTPRHMIGRATEEVVATRNVPKRRSTQYYLKLRT